MHVKSCFSPRGSKASANVCGTDEAGGPPVRWLIIDVISHESGQARRVCARARTGVVSIVVITYEKWKRQTSSVFARRMGCVCGTHGCGWGAAVPTKLRTRAAASPRRDGRAPSLSGCRAHWALEPAPPGRRRYRLCSKRDHPPLSPKPHTQGPACTLWAVEPACRVAYETRNAPLSAASTRARSRFHTSRNSHRCRRRSAASLPVLLYPKIGG